MNPSNIKFIDLGLPSGTLWATENAVVNGKTYFNFDEAVEAFGDTLPSKEAWKELFNHCNRKWDDERNGYILTGPNGNTIFLPAKGVQHWNEETKKLNGGRIYNADSGVGLYWSSSPYGAGSARYVSFLSFVVDLQFYGNHLYGFSVRLCKSK